MANNRIQIKRTSTSGRTPNTTNSGNSQYIAAGELALNMPDSILYTSNGTSLITIGTKIPANSNLTISANSSIDFDTTTYKPTYQKGRMYWDNEEQTIIVYGDGTSSFEIALGQREWVRTRNSTASTIPKGTPVYITGVHIPGNPVHGHHPTIEPGDASDYNKSQIIGITGEDIAPSSHGYTVVRGYIEGLDTSALTSGQRAHLGFLTPGTIVQNAPTFPNFPTDLGMCLTSNSTVGTFYVDLAMHTAERFRTTADMYVGGDLTVFGNFNVTGNVVTTNATNLSVGGNILYLASGDTIPASGITHTGGGLNDMLFHGVYEGTTSQTYYVKIDSTGTTDTFAWSKDNFATTIAANVTITTTPYALDNGLSIQFNADNGHRLGDIWYASAAPVNVDLGWVGNYNDGTYHHTGLFRDASDGVYKFFQNYTPEPNAAVNIDTSDVSFQLASVQANTFTGNLVGTASSANNANNTTYLNGKTEGNLNVNSSISSNSSTYLGGKTEDNLNVNSALTANASTYLNGKTEGNLNVNSAANALNANNSSYLNTKTESNLNVNNATTAYGKTESNLNVNSALTANNSTYLNTKTESNLNVNSALTANNSAYLGTVAAASYVNTSGAYTISGVHTHNANVVFATTAGLSANSSYGTAGQVLASNGTSVFWTADQVSNAITANAITSNSLSANYISISLGTISVGNSTVNTDIGNNYISVGNNTYNYVNVYSDRIFIGNTSSNAIVNSTIYTGTAWLANSALNANNAAYLGTVAAASYVNTSGTYTITGVHTYNANIIIGTTAGLRANGTFGLAGQVLASNGTSVFWTADQGANSITANSLTANYVAITTGTITVGNSTVNTDIGNNYISVGNVSSYVNVYSDRIFIGNTVSNATVNSTVYTGTANNASNLNGKTESNLNVNNATTAYGKTEGNLNVNSAANALNANNAAYLGTVAAANYAQLSGAAFTGNVSITGNLIVTGTTVSINATTLDVKDLNITVAKGSATAATADGAGLTVDTANIGWYYNNASNTWQSNVGITPSSNNSFDLGTTGLRWSNVYANNITGTLTTTSQPNITANSATYLNGKTEGNLNVNSATNALNANNAAYLGTVIASDYATKTYITGLGYIASIGGSGNVAYDSSRLGGTDAASFVQNTDSRILSGNLNFTGANNVFGTMYTVGAQPATAANSVSANTTALLIGNSTVYAIINSTSYTGTIGGVYTGTLTSSQVTTALTYTPYNSTNPSGYLSAISGSGNVAYDSSRLGGTLAASYLTTSSTYGGTLTSSQVTTALTYTPYNSTNPSNFISSIGGAGNVAYDSSRLGATAAASFVQNTDSRTLSGNLNFTGTNNVFGTMYTVGAVPSAVGNSVSANTTTILIGNSTVFATINSTSYTGTASVSIPAYVVNTSGNFTIGGNLNFNATNTYFTTNMYAKAQIVIDALGDLVFTNGSGIQANGNWGSSGQALTADGSGNMYWSTITGSTNVNATYAWTNTHSFSNTITFNGPIVSTNTISANGSVGTAAYVLTSGGAGANVYWAAASGGGSWAGGTMANSVYFSNTAVSTNATSGAVTVLGGLGVANNIYTAGRVGFSNSTNISVAYTVYNQTLNTIDTVFG